MERIDTRRRKGWPGWLLVLCLATASILSAQGRPAAEPVLAAQAAVAAQAGEQAAFTAAMQVEPGVKVRFLPLVLRGGMLSTFLPLITVDHAQPSSAFGVQMVAVDDARGLQQAVDADVHWVRSAVFSWQAIEPTRTNPPTYHWDQVDEASLLNAAQNAMRFLGQVHFSPSWAQKIPGYSCGPIRPDALDEFAQFLQALVSRYKQPPYNVHDWELWNEPDVDPSQVAPDSGYGCWGDKNDAYFGGGYYAEMLKVAYPTIKLADPQARVLVGGLLLDCDPNNQQCPAEKRLPSMFLEGILRNGGGPYFSIVAFHSYTYYGGRLGAMSNPNWPGSVTAIPEKVSFLRGVLQEYGYQRKPLLGTEAAAQCFTATPDCLETQAMYVPRAFAESLALGLRAQIYYKMVDDGWRNVGLLKRDLTSKPAYLAYATASLFLSAVQYQAVVDGYPAGIEGYAFARPRNGGNLDVIWSADGSPQSVPLPSGASAFDRYGASIGGSGTIQVDHSPVYVVRP